MKILIVDDDINISNILNIALSQEGHETQVYNDSGEAKTALEENMFDLIILDIMMPKFNGYDLCKIARSYTDAPIIFTTCLDDEQSLISALNIGGDDYIKKPFSVSEVIVRVKTHLRKRELYMGGNQNKVFKEDQIVFFPNDRLVIENNKKIYLSPIESDLLTYFFENRNQILTYRMIYEAIWKEAYIKDKSTIMVRVSNLRNKISSIDITSVRGEGYIFKK